MGTDATKMAEMKNNRDGSQEKVRWGHEHAWYSLSTLLGASQGHLSLASVFQKTVYSLGRLSVIQTSPRLGRRAELR